MMLSSFLLDNLNIKVKIKMYARENSTTMSIELISEHIHETILPTMVKGRHDVIKTSDTYD